tara:strand:- start:374 stop:2371 length:1998 start_codon:yes stop_codon:yes gene_type:complete
LKYRAEIDGLRAIAVVSVILYHAQIVFFGRDWFEGGFIGVDIFFVISGYLITQIILAELEETNTFSFIKFYERRARRILPMLLLVISICIPFAWQELLPKDLVDFAKSALSAIGFGSNFFFYFSTTEYGADSALLKPLLHTWSLGVEEQFYIIVPIIIILIWTFTRSSLLPLLIIMLLLSLQFADIMEGKNSELNFFLPFSRFWELFVGSVLAFSELKYGRVKNLIFKQALPTFGLFLIAFSILFFDSSTPHPSFQTSIPILGVALILASCSTDDFVGKVLSFKPIVGVGLISYSLYLWHFPIFAFGRIGSSNPSAYDKVEWIVLSFILSITSYYLVEKPFRNSNFLKPKIFFSTVIIIVFALLYVNFKIINNEGYRARVTEYDLVLNGLLSEPYSELLDDQGRNCFGSTNINFCTFSRKTNNKNIILIGDSVMASLSNEFTKLFFQNGFNVTVMTNSACYFVPDSSLYKLDGSERIIGRQKCDEEYQMKRLNAILEAENSTVVIGGTLERYFGPNKKLKFVSSNGLTVAENIENGISKIISKKHKVILIYPHPLPKVHVSKHAINYIDELNFIEKDNETIRSSISNEIKIPVKEYKEATKGAFAFYDSMEKYNVVPIFPHRMMCDDLYCSFIENNNLLVVDNSHFSNFFANKLSVLIYDKINEN